MERVILERTGVAQAHFDQVTRVDDRDFNTTYTFTGLPFDVTNQNKWNFDKKDIAMALANTCRFGGMISPFYSVAEHSVKVSRLLREEGAPPDVQLVGLLHDATEAYILDIPRPWKHKVRIGYMPYVELEARMMDAIIDWERDRHGVDLSYAYENDWDVVAQADMDIYEEENATRTNAGRASSDAYWGPHSMYHLFLYEWAGLEKDVLDAQS